MSEVGNIDYSVDLNSVAKTFLKSTLSGSSYTTLKSVLFGFFKKKKNQPKTEAIKDLTIRIPKGASVGVIGRNGSGKSTLLKLITGIYKPDEGYVQVNGRVAALIELGAGFHPDFTGRENLFLGGVLHGLSKKEIQERFDEIVKFAELEDFIDDPVRTYSSGMFMRLGFSLAVHTNPDILLIDEVLAVGDAKFVIKCKEKIAELRKQEKTLFLVSHDLAAIEEWSDEVIWLQKGEVRDRGEPRRVIDHYRESIEQSEEEDLSEQMQKVATSTEESHEDSYDKEDYERWGSREIEIDSIELQDRNGAEKHVFHAGDTIQIAMKYKKNSEFKDLVFGFAISRADGVEIIGTNTEIEKIDINSVNSQGDILVKIPDLQLLDHTYYVDVAAHRKDGYAYDYHKRIIKFAVRSNKQAMGVYNLSHEWSIN